MLKNFHLDFKVTFVLKCLLFAYLLTAGLLLLLALLLYRFELSEQIVSIAIIVIYVVVTFLAGFFAGKKMGARKFLWGLLMGAAYFIVLLLVSLAVGKGLSGVTNDFVTVMLLCTGSGMLGGMVS
ncbi:MAG: TIGR04086 family membrane protein [Lachnospiraceae bacterium]|nr:TIGR04086 family membrane protein [Lachnospiraceae bacterium]